MAWNRLRELWHWTLHKVGDIFSLRYDSNLCFKWNLAHGRRNDNDIFTTGLYNTMTTQQAVSSVATGGGDSAGFKAIFWCMQTRVRKQIL